MDYQQYGVELCIIWRYGEIEVKSSRSFNILSWVITLLVPITLVLTSVRVLLSPAFINIEYKLPGFPPDPYGFSQEDRLYWSDTARNYLLNDEGISFLAELRFPDGQTTPPASCTGMDDCSKLYNDRELKHMLDVKNVVQSALNIWILSVILLISLGVWAWFGGWWQRFRWGLGRGGWLTIGILAGLMLFVILAFGIIFVAFHNVFFESGTWTFHYSDTLIRLFPERFWRDAFLAVGLLAGGSGLVLGLLFGRKTKRPE
jgi:integral membrane protein (TIGR01906 family)